MKHQTKDQIINKYLSQDQNVSDILLKTEFLKIDNLDMEMNQILVFIQVQHLISKQNNQKSSSTQQFIALGFYDFYNIMIVYSIKIFNIEHLHLCLQYFKVEQKLATFITYYLFSHTSVSCLFSHEYSNFLGQQFCIVYKYKIKNIFKLIKQLLTSKIQRYSVIRQYKIDSYDKSVLLFFANISLFLYTKMLYILILIQNSEQIKF
ncbi:hypothetical protein pb186bvf_001654 [Paramecium bursaria]